MTETALCSGPAGPQGLGSRLAAASLAASMVVWSGLACAAPAPESFAPLAEKVSPAVVNIASKTEVKGSQGAMPEIPFAVPKGSPFEDFFKQFREQFGNHGRPQQAPRRATGLGSGFIIDPAGYVVTNNHVIDSASEITIRLDDDSTYTAEIVGTDPQTDLALLKIDAERALPSLELGDSDGAKVGDWVLAVGNPFGLGGTVTAGIISARGRNIQAGPYDDFLQVDASINRGNSGGPLFDLDGKVIGVNTAIFSPNGGNVGIGFAIPSNMVKAVVTQLRETGKVERGWLGVQIQNVTPDLAEALGLDEAAGALVAKVTPGSPAEAAGLEPGDVILDFAGARIDDPRELARVVAERAAETEAEITVWRGGQDQQLTVVTGRQPAPQDMAADTTEPTPSGSYHSSSLGARLATLTPQRRAEHGIGEELQGVLVLEIGEGSIFEQNLRRGDVIVKVDSVAVTQPREVEQRIEEAKSDSRKAVLVLINRSGEARFLGLKLGVA